MFPSRPIVSHINQTQIPSASTASKASHFQVALATQSTVNAQKPQATSKPFDAEIKTYLLALGDLNIKTTDRIIELEGGELNKDFQNLPFQFHKISQELTPETFKKTAEIQENILQSQEQHLNNLQKK